MERSAVMRGMPFMPRSTGTVIKPFDFLGRVTRPLGDDLDPRRRKIGIGIHRQPVQRTHAGAQQN